MDRFWSILARFETRLLGTITGVDTQHDVAALTFDDGPHPEYTPRLLQVLRRHGARATFFMIGEVAQKHPEMVRMVAQAGHAIGNHSWNHPSFPLLSSKQRRSQIRACRRALAPHGLALFRPPYGDQDRASRLDAALLGQQVITWSLTAYDWLNPETEWLVDRLSRKIRPGSILLFHDALHTTPDPRYADRGPMLEAVDEFLAQMPKRLSFVTVPQLLRLGRARRGRWVQRSNPAWLKGQKLASYRQEVRR